MSSLASAAPLSVGVFGLYGFPLRRDDLAPGPFGGAKVRASVRGPFAVELQLASFREGDRDFRVRGRREMIRGGTETFFLGQAIAGVPGPGDAALYLGFGGGAYEIERAGHSTADGPAWCATVGIERRSNSTLAVDASVRWIGMPLDPQGGRETVAFQAGVNYYILP